MASRFPFPLSAHAKRAKEVWAELLDWAVKQTRSLGDQRPFPDNVGTAQRKDLHRMVEALNDMFQESGLSIRYKSESKNFDSGRQVVVTYVDPNPETREVQLISLAECSEKLKKRFAKDCGLPVSWESGELHTMNRLYHLDEHVAAFHQVVVGEQIENESQFFAVADKLQERIVRDLLATEGYSKLATAVREKRFLKEGLFELDHSKLPKGKKSSRLYRVHHCTAEDDWQLVSVDISAASWSCFRLYDETMCLGARTWPQLVSRYTPYSLYRKSKMLRQWVMGSLPEWNIVMNRSYKALSLKIQRAVYHAGLFTEPQLLVCASDEVIWKCPNIEQKEAALRQVLTKWNPRVAEILRVEVFRLIPLQGSSNGYLRVIRDQPENAVLKGVIPEELADVTHALAAGGL